MQLLRGIVHPQIGPLVSVVLRQSFDAEETTAFEAHGYAIIDSGAELSGIDEDLAIRLKLPPRGTLAMTRPGPSPDFTACLFEGQVAFMGTFPDHDARLVGYRSLDMRLDDGIRIVALLGRDWMRRCRVQIHASQSVEVHWIG